ncbi:CD209 antigen-like protein E [Nematolebias whitei]|uniref:CD209 antigen-like protein E n=1 Tax=Nematolebias whitei TaxID=451745 RepID=UPI001899F7DB|nr:CD209 antigen-like protein E [Nematolebias whitei]
MEEIHVEDENHVQVPATNRRGSKSSKKKFYCGIFISSGLLTVFLLARLITFGLHYNLTEHLQNTEDKLSSVTEERDLLNATLTEMTEELLKMKSWYKQKKTCPAGWKMFSYSCYFFSSTSASWDQGREDCRTRGADLVVVNDADEQEFISIFSNKIYWIGLTDKETEGSWEWVDGTPLDVTYWASGQPDDGGGNPKWGKEDCAQNGYHEKMWNDLSCEASSSWICEKVAQYA